MKFKDKVVLITGGARGLGKEISTGFAWEGAQVVIADINIDDAEALSRKLNSEGRECSAVKVDVSDHDSIAEMVRETVKRYETIDILINNAGIYTTCEFENITPEIWDRMLDLNLKGVFFITQSIVPYMKDKKQGKIVNIASTGFAEGLPFMSHYVASKGGVIGLTRSLATELGKYNINVNAISPGMILTDTFKTTRSGDLVDSIVKMQVFQRAATPEDYIGPIFFLSSKDSDWMTGQNIYVDGGLVFN